MNAIASQFQPLLHSIKAAVDHENWLAGLALTLILPDVCSKIERQKAKGQRYARWWDENFGSRYQYGKGSSDYVKGEEVYQLRCAYLHEAKDVQAGQRINAAVERFKFTASKNHLEKEGTSVLLNAQAFCLDMCSRVETWEKNIVSHDSSMRREQENC